MSNTANRNTRSTGRTNTLITAEPAPKQTATRTTASTLNKTIKRKPLVDRNNDRGAHIRSTPQIVKAKPSIRTPQAEVKPISPDSEPIIAYLRIRPHTEFGDEAAPDTPYLQKISDKQARMTDPNSSGSPLVDYNFSQIFDVDTPQTTFFETTTLPLIEDVLNGRNALAFAYGVTNSGKTYTVHGGSSNGSAGILPRTLDVIFNSIDGLHSQSLFQPVRLNGIERVDSTLTSSGSSLFDISALAGSEQSFREVIDQLKQSEVSQDVDPTVLKVDRNHEYSVWVSYAEVYNEQVFDLLQAQNTTLGKDRNVSGPIIKRKALLVKNSPPSDGAAGRYIDGLKKFRVHSAEQAKEIIRKGQLHRKAFGTMANSESSRSHGLVTITVVRAHRGAKNDPESIQVSRLTLVDLAGSERNKKTQTTGDRLKEAGNINRSLLVLGQCMEVMRSNQRRIAQSLAIPGRTDTVDVKRGLGVVPFRHSKVTEVLMDYFDRDGRGRVVMIVNINPFDTDFHENAHVMKFAALAREVQVAPAVNPMLRTPGRVAMTRTNFTPKRGSTTRNVILTAQGAGRRKSVTQLQIMEEDADDCSDDDEGPNGLVEALFDEIDSLRTKLYDAEMRCALIEAQTREQVVREIAAQNKLRQRNHQRQLDEDEAENEWKIDAKIDMLQRTGILASPKKMGARELSPENFETEISLLSAEDSEEGFSSDGDSTSALKTPRLIRQVIPDDGLITERLLTDDEEAQLTTDADDSFSTESSVVSGSTEAEDEEEDYDPIDNFGQDQRQQSAVQKAGYVYRVTKGMDSLSLKEKAQPIAKRETRSTGKAQTSASTPKPRAAQR